MNPLLLQVIFRMFDYTDCPEGPILPGQHSIERYLIEEQLRHVLKVSCHFVYFHRFIVAL